MASYQMKRKEDTQENRALYKREANHGRVRTLILSMILAGIVAWFIGHIVEINIYNEQRIQLVKGCKLVNEDRRDIGTNLAKEADNILGNPKKNVEPFKFEGTSFEEFRPLIVTNALRNRSRADDYLNRLENCQTLYPKRELPIIG